MSFAVMMQQAETMKAAQLAAEQMEKDAIVARCMDRRYAAMQPILSTLCRRSVKHQGVTL